MSELSDRILDWYQVNGRSLPWRGYPDPYAVWVSEVMLQQTQVATVIPYYKRWMRIFPGVRELADASEQKVLSIWEGLGYYSRARNLHNAARIIVDRFGGRLPEDASALEDLPGVGRYTAAAIASIAFGKDEATLDGNIRRVLARVFNVTEPVATPRGEAALWELARTNLPPGRAGEYNQALMDLGAGVCVPRQPHCLDCPFADLCNARILGVQEARPVKLPRRSIPTRLRATAVIQRGGMVLLSRRPSSGLLGGLWEFPNVPVEALPRQELAPALREVYGLTAQLGTELGIVRHAYTHFKVIVRVYACKAQSAPDGLRWTDVGSLADFPMGKVDRTISSWLRTARSSDKGA
jgi:A/G-specific adenine glycosylase